MTTPPIRPATPGPSDDHDALPAGTRFGEFEILRVLGVGGFGIVYLAQDHSLERKVALKEYMPTSLAVRGAGPLITLRSDSQTEIYAMGLRSFINEARLLARFDHPSLVKVYRFWEDNATAYMVMPYLQGTTLRDARRAMSAAPDEAWIRGVLDPMLDALEQLHREGVYHRDIAPDNILIPQEGAPILLDFGAARHVISDRTQSLTAILKPSYAPIEQYADLPGMRQGPWTDIYALGAVMHYLLFGVPPAPATARALQNDVEWIEKRVVPGVSPRLIGVVAWMLGVRPSERPQNVASVRAALAGQIPVPSASKDPVTVPSYVSMSPAIGSAPDERGPESTVRLEGRHAGPAWIDAPTESVAHRPTLVQPAVHRSSLHQTTAHQTTTPLPRSLQQQPEITLPPAGPETPTVSTGASADAVPRRLRWTLAGKTAAGSVAALVLGLLLWQFIALTAAPRSSTSGGVAAGAEAAPAASAAPVGQATASAVGAGLPQAASAGLRPGTTAVPAGAETDAVLAANAASGPVAATVGVPAAAVAGGSSAAQAAASSAATGPTASAGATAAARGAEPGVAPASATRSRAKPPILQFGVGSAAPLNDVASRRITSPSARPELARPVKQSSTRKPATAREACGDRQFISMAICLDNECENPRFREGAECVRVLEVKRRRTEH